MENNSEPVGFTPFYITGNNELLTIQEFCDLLIGYMDEDTIKQYNIDDLRTIIFKELLDITMLLMPSVIMRSNTNETGVVEYALRDSNIILFRLDKLTQTFGGLKFIGDDIKTSIINVIGVLLHMIYNGYKLAVGSDIGNSSLHYVELESIVNLVWPNFFTIRLKYTFDIPF